jgi:hypothetical protein
MNYKKVVINLDIMTKAMFDKFNTFAHLQFKPQTEIWKHYPKTGAGNYNGNTMFNEAPILETLLVLDHIKENHPNTKPEFWYNTSLFIYNDEVYNIIGGKCLKVDLDNLLFISFREAWSHPFWKIFKVLLEKNGGKLSKPNMATMTNNGCMNKFFGIQELYPNRDEFLGDIIIPYSIKTNELDTFINFISEKLGNKIVIKKDCIQEGKGVMFRDLTRDGMVEKMKNDIKSHKNRGSEVIITPAFDIKREYRCYFTNDESGKKVYSIKQRVNETDIDVYSKDNIQIYKNISAKWHEVKTDSQEFKIGTDKSVEMMDLMSYDTGSLEFAETTDGKFVFFEVNQMAGPLPFDGEDTENMQKYYSRMLERMFS